MNHSTPVSSFLALLLKLYSLTQRKAAPVRHNAPWKQVMILAVTVAGCGGGGGPAQVGSTSAGYGTATGAAAANAGADISTTLPEGRVRLAGSAQGVGVEWVQVSGPAQAFFKSTKSAATWVLVETPGEYVFRLAATDVANVTRTDEVKLTVNPNPVVVGASSTVLDHLKAATPPLFKAGNTLLPLTMSYGGLSPVLAQEVARHWGFAYQFPLYGSNSREPASYWNGNWNNTSLFIQDIKAQPGRFKIAVQHGSLYRIFENHHGQDAFLPRLDPSTWLRDANEAFIFNGTRPIVSPMARDDQMFRVGEFVGNTLAALEESTGQAVDIYLNEGEYGLGIPGDNDYAAFFGRDPRVLQAFQQSGIGDWSDFVSLHKARQERQIKLGALRNASRQPVYSYYGEGYGGERGRWAGWSWFMHRYERFIGADGRPLVSDFAQPETYYRLHNSGWSGIQSQQGIALDALTQVLKSVGGSISLGQRHFYPWMSMGWEGSGLPISDDDRYLGMLKMWYTAGAIGSVAGYFNSDDPIFSALRNNQVIGTATPIHIRQLMLHGHAHALFSHLEEYLRNGDLLPGPNTHIYQSFTPATPAMEFPVDGQTESVSGPNGSQSVVPTARLLARKIRGEDRWLLAVWANVGADRTVTAMVDPRLGRLSLMAPKAGAIYIAQVVNSQPTLRRIDADPLNPTRYLFP